MRDKRKPWKIIGKNIRLARKSQGYSIEALAKIMDVPASYLGLVERGKRGLPIHCVDLVMKTLDITMDDLFVEEKPDKEGKPA